MDRLDNKPKKLQVLQNKKVRIGKAMDPKTKAKLSKNLEKARAVRTKTAKKK